MQKEKDQKQFETKRVQNQKKVEDLSRELDQKDMEIFNMKNTLEQLNIREQSNIDILSNKQIWIYYQNNFVQ